MKSFRDFGIDLPDRFHGDRKTTCPKCSESRRNKHEPCLSVNGDEGVWKCHHCGWTGTIHEGEHHEYRPQRKIYRRPAPETVRPDMVPEVRDYFHRRGISDATILKTGCYSTVRFLRATNCDTVVMAFPYYRNGELLNVKYRDARKNMTQEQDPEPCCWNIDHCVKAETVYITEGEFDAATLVECGFDAACSVDKGAPNVNDESADKKCECVMNCMDVFETAAEIVLVTDKDPNGLRLEKELIARIGAGKCFTCRYPADCKDINDVLVKHGREAVIRCVSEAEPVPVPGLHEFGEFRDRILKLYRHGTPRGLTTGWPELDAFFTLQPGSLNIITGIPMSGKSEFVHAMMVNAIRLNDWKIGIFSPEMLPEEELFANFAEKIIGKPFFGPEASRIEPEELERALALADAAVKVILPEEDRTPTLDEILTAARVAVVRHGIRALVLDPYNEIESSRPAAMTETEYISKVLSRLRQFARRYQLWVGMVAHPTKLQKDQRTGEYPVPTPYDISGSANWRNKADNCLSLWRSFRAKNNIVEVHIQKIKRKGIGKLGFQKFQWNRANGQYTPVPEDGPYTAEDCPPPRSYRDE